MGDHIDVGAGSGTFVEELHRVGDFRSLIALEPSVHAAAECRTRGLCVVMQELEMYAAAGETTYDSATSLELLEHVFSPEAFLVAAHAIVREGGIFIFSCLSGTGWDIVTLREHSEGVSPPHHLNFLNPRSITLLAQRTGWEVLDVFTPGALDVDIVEGFQRRNPTVPLDPFAREICGAEAQVKEAFQAFLAGNRLSSHMWTVLRRT